MSSTTIDPAAAPAGQDRPAWWRTVLGEYPTGVAIVTSVDEQRRPVGMVIGSFTAVSDDPALIGFLPGVNSRTWMQMKGTSRFRISVLGSQHEQLCRDFARDPSSRFATGSWAYDPDGIPILSDALTWFDAETESVTPAGDHVFVLGRVTAFGVGDGAAGLPLIYLKGSYGSFAVPRLEFDLTEFGTQLRHADDLREVLQALAGDVTVDCLLTTVVRDSVIVLASSDAPGGSSSSLVGASFPFAAPMAPVFAAWSSLDRETVWIENSRHLVGAVDRPQLASLLDEVRSRGYSVSIGEAMARHFDDVISQPQTNRSHLSALWTRIQRDYQDLQSEPDWQGHVSSIQVPVFGPDGTTKLELVVSGFAPCSAERFAHVVERALAASRALTQHLAGTAPDEHSTEGRP